MENDKNKNKKIKIKFEKIINKNDVEKYETTIYKIVYKIFKKYHIFH